MSGETRVPTGIRHKLIHENIYNGCRVHSLPRLTSTTKHVLRYQGTLRVILTTFYFVYLGY